MKILVLISNLIISIVGGYFIYHVYTTSEVIDTPFLVMSLLLYLTIFINLIYIFKSRPFDREKEKLRKQINELKNL